MIWHSLIWWSHEWDMIWLCFIWWWYQSDMIWPGLIWWLQERDTVWWPYTMITGKGYDLTALYNDHMKWIQSDLALYDDHMKGISSLALCDDHIKMKVIWFDLGLILWLHERDTIWQPYITWKGYDLTWLYMMIRWEGYYLTWCYMIIPWDTI